MSSNVQSTKREKGQSLVEFAFMLFVLLVLVTGIVDASRAFFTYLAMRDAAQEGALYGSTDPCNTTEISNRVQHTSTMLEDIWPDLTVTSSIIGPHCVGGTLRVTVAYDNFVIAMPFIGTFLGKQTVPIKASIINTILSPKCPNTCP